jgi:hypothetical protein
VNKASGFALADQRTQRHGSTGNVPLLFMNYSDDGFA